MKETRKTRRRFTRHPLIGRFKKKTKAITAMQVGVEALAEAKAKDEAEKRAYAEEIAKAKEKLKTESEARAKAEEKLRAEIEGRAKAERKAKAEAKKMLVEQYRNYSALAERVEAKAAEAIAAAKAEAEEKVQSYAAALAQAQEELTKAKEEAEKRLKAETEARLRVEAESAEAMVVAKAEAEEKIQSYAAALAQAQEKLAKAKEEAEEKLKAETEERPKVKAEVAETRKTFKRAGQPVFHQRAMKRKFAFFSVLAILLAIALVMIMLSVVDNRLMAEGDIATTQEDMPVSIALMGGDPDGEPLTYNVVTGPAHGSLSGTAPSITYTPALNYNGSDSFTFTVNNGRVDSKPATVLITVTAVDDAPIANPQSKTTKMDEPVSITLTGSDVDNDTLMFAICTQPGHGVLSLGSNFNNKGKLTYRPNPNFTGPDSFTFKLNDGIVDSAVAMVSINVAPNGIPVADPQSVTTVEDTFAVITLMSSDPDGDPLTYSVVKGPSHGNLNGIAPNLTYTPNTNFNGTDSFTFKVNDGKADSAAATVSITVKAANDPPVANDDSVTTQEDTPAIAINVLANDTDLDNDPLTVSAVTQGSSGSVTINTDSTLTYTPNANFFGTDSFIYTVRDSKGGIDTAKVNVTVGSVDDAPVITSTPITTVIVGALYAYDVKAKDRDVGDTLTYSLTTKPEGMTIDPATGLIEWKPTNDNLGANDVVVKVMDSYSVPASDTQSFTITVKAISSPQTLTIVDGYDQKSNKTLLTGGKADVVGASDNEWLETDAGLYTSYDFLDVPIPPGAKITSVAVYVEHFEQEQFPSGKLQWDIGTGWPRKPVIWLSISAPVHEGTENEALDSWDVTSIVDTPEKINSLQLQVKNNDNIAKKKTLVDYIYAVVEWY